MRKERKIWKMERWIDRELELFNRTNEGMKEYSDVVGETIKKFFKSIMDLPVPRVAEEMVVELFNRNVLTPIEDVDEDWDLLDDSNGGDYSIFKNQRYPSLYKKVTNKNEPYVVYTDTNRMIVIDIDSGLQRHTQTIDLFILDRTLPITMPYQPGEKIKMLTKTLEDDENGILVYAIMGLQLSDNSIKPVKRFFKIDQNEDWTEIGLSEYAAMLISINSRQKHSL